MQVTAQKRKQCTNGLVSEPVIVTRGSGHLRDLQLKLECNYLGILERVRLGYDLQTRFLVFFLLPLSCCSTKEQGLGSSASVGGSDEREGKAAVTFWQRTGRRAVALGRVKRAMTR